MSLTTTIIVLIILWSAVAMGIPVMLHINRNAKWYIPYSVIIAGVTTFALLHRYF